VPRMGDYFAGSPFRARFEKKGRFSAFTAQIPTMLITASYPALAGAAAVLAQHLATPAGKAPTPMTAPKTQMDVDHARF
jgi:glucokinase